MDELRVAQTLTALRDLSCLCTQFVSPFIGVFVLAAVVHMNHQVKSLKCLCPRRPSLLGGDFSLWFVLKHLKHQVAR